MSDTDFTDEKMKKLLADAGVDPGTSLSDRRSFPRYGTHGQVTFHRPHEKNVHTGTLLNISEGGLAFFTQVSLAVGERLLLSYQEEDDPQSSAAAAAPDEGERGRLFVLTIPFNCSTLQAVPVRWLCLLF